MSIKRLAAAAAVAAGLGASVTVFHAGFANSVPCPNWQHDKTCDPPPANQGPGYGGSSPVPTPGSQVPGAGTPHVTTSPPGVTTHVTTSPPWSGSSTPSTSPPWSGSSTPSTSPPWSGSSTPSTSAPWSGTTQPGERSSYPPTPTRPVLNAPTTQPEHPPYYPPRGDIPRGTPQYGGPVDLPTGFWLPGRGAPTPPRPSGYGWNDGPPPGSPPPNWEGPPPAGGWNGPPPPGGWNRPWVGPPRDVTYGQRYFAPFTYNTYTVLPVFNWQYGGWGYWFDGVWAPLY
jgi:hypothetical protein